MILLFHSFGHVSLLEVPKVKVDQAGSTGYSSLRPLRLCAKQFLPVWEGTTQRKVARVQWRKVKPGQSKSHCVAASRSDPSKCQGNVCQGNNHEMSHLIHSFDNHSLDHSGLLVGSVKNQGESSWVKVDQGESSHFETFFYALRQKWRTRSAACANSPRLCIVHYPSSIIHCRSNMFRVCCSFYCRLSRLLSTM
jgi:hypothetical protein